MPHSTDWQQARRDLERKALSDAVPDDDRELAREFLDVLSGLDGLRSRWLPRLAEGAFPVMMRSRADTVRFLTDPDGGRRYVALILLLGQWGPAAGEVELYEQLARKDSDARVRAGALSCLGACYGGTKDPEAGTLFAAIVREETETPEVRSAAYDALLRLQGRSPWDEFGPPGKIRFPADIDWSFVDSFLAAEANGAPPSGVGRTGELPTPGDPS